MRSDHPPCRHASCPVLRQQTSHESDEHEAPMNTKHLLLAAALLTASTLHAQTASYRYVGSSCTTGRLPSSAPIPVPLVVSGVPRLGTTFQVVTECSFDPPSGHPTGYRRLVFLLNGATNTAIGGVPLPFDIATLAPGQPWCGLLRTSMDVVLPVQRLRDTRFSAVISIAVPNTPSLAGMTFYQQVISIETTTLGPPFSAVALSEGGVAVIGF